MQGEAGLSHPVIINVYVALGRDLISRTRERQKVLVRFSLERVSVGSQCRVANAVHVPIRLVVVYDIIYPSRSANLLSKNSEEACIVFNL